MYLLFILNFVIIQKKISIFGVVRLLFHKKLIERILRYFIQHTLNASRNCVSLENISTFAFANIQYLNCTFWKMSYLFEKLNKYWILGNLFQKD